MIRKTFIFLLFLVFITGCTAQFDGSTAIQEVFAEKLIEDDVYLDKGALTLIIRQDKSVVPLTYYLVEIEKRSETGPFHSERIEYENTFDIIVPLEIARGVYTITVTGYRENSNAGHIALSSGRVEDYLLDGEGKTLEIQLLSEGHSHRFIWFYDDTYHWKGCEDCIYIVDGTREEHSYTIGEGDNLYCICGRPRPVDGASSGFNAEEGDIEPKGHFTGSRNGTAWTLTFVDDNPRYPSSVVAWFIDGIEVETDDADKKGMETTIEPYERVLVRCLFKNEKGYGSFEAMIDGNNNGF